ncbi:kinesin-like protein KIN-14K [Cannabis sativa]|uniref:kinesin-like protein KIN-14K n=1 Tax=Cannabis sativa TaxID=3483 RepID=UPI0029C9F431|nr:kinesin-like protein KIN-14K [Cannabis sativa]
MNSMTENRAKEHGRNSNVAANGDFSAQVLTSNGELEGSSTPKSESPKGGFSSPLSGEEKRKILSESKFQRSLKSPILSDPSTTLTHVGNYKFHEVFQLKQGRYMDLPPSKISEMMKSNSLDNAPTQSLLSVVNSILDESVERNNSEIPHRVACLLRKVVQEIERRISTQAEHLRTQNNLFKAREEKYQSRIRVLEALAIGTNEETENEKNNREEKKKEEDESLIRLTKEKDQSNVEILALKQELEMTKNHCLDLEKEAKNCSFELEEKLKTLEKLYEDSKNKVIELESFSETKSQSWNKKEHFYQRFMEIQFGAFQDLRLSSNSIKQEIIKAKENYTEEINNFGFKLKTLANAAQNYHSVLAENRKIFNELQELKGNIRVYCRIRPFLPGQKERKTIIEHIDENGELIVANPSKPGKDGHRLFKFNKVFGQASTQEDVFSDTQPLIRSVLDGYNVCIFAYGQTGSGKTYTMTGPNASSKENWGVNYRALSDLFSISQTRKSSISYEIGVQMIEIYNEQVKDLLSNDNSQKKLGIVTHYQPNGLAVPDASMHPVKSTSDVIELMEIGLKNRSVSFTALNERSSRSHSCVTIHVRGLDSKTGATLHGNLHLVDLAGSERVDRSEVTGDRLKEAQHINKSLSALGDVIFALAQKSSHVPYRNSKLTQVLQSSLGGQAKTLMFVQLNPDVTSYSETMSTLKFAERVSGVELGAARSNKEGRDVRELVEQVASLKNTIAKKDEEIERLQLLKVHPGTSSLLKYTSPSLNRESEKNGNNVPKKSIRNSSSGKSLGGLTEKTTSSDHDNSSDYSDSQHSMEHDERPQSMSVDEHNRDHDHGDDHDHEDHHGDYDERLSDTSDNGTSIGADTDGSAENVVFAQIPKSNSSERLGRISRPTQKSENAKPTSPLSKGSLKISTSLKKTSSVNTTPTKSRTRQWQ